MTVSDTWADWKTTASLDTPPATATPEIDKELRNIKAQVKANVVPGRWAADDAGLTALITAIGSSQAEIVIDSALTINPTGATYNIPANITLKTIKPGAFAVANNKTLAIAGPFEAGIYPVFSWTGAGAIDLTGSPTAKIPLPWFGAVAGVTQNCSAAYVKLAASIGSHQSMYLPKGIWRTTSALVFTNSPCFGIVGDDVVSSLLWLDVGANVGLTFTDCFDLRIDKIGIVGPATACTTGLYINGGTVNFGTVNIHLGSTGYAFRADNVIYGYIQKLDIGHYDGFYGPLNIVRPHDGIYLGGGPSAPDNAWDMNVNISGGNSTEITNGIYVTGGSNLRITGSIEGCVNPAQLIGPAAVGGQLFLVKLDNINMVDANTHGLFATNTIELQITNCDIMQDSVLTGCRDTTFVGGHMDTLTIQPSCYSTAIDGTTIEHLYNYAADTQFPSAVRMREQAVNTYCLSPAQGMRNFVQNADFNLWPASGPPTGWDDGASGATFTKCGTGLVDTTNHNTAYCCLMNTNGVNVILTYASTTEDLLNLKGQMVSFSWLIKMMDPGSGDAPVTFPRLLFIVTVPDWSTGLTVKQGDVVSPSAAYIAAHGDPNFKYKANNAGVTHGVTEPTWPTTRLATVTDNGITWTAIDLSSYSAGATPLTSADFGIWRQLVATCEVPRNATALSFYGALYKGTSHDIDYYIAEPAILAGPWVPRGFEGGQYDQVINTLRLQEITEPTNAGTARAYFFIKNNGGGGGGKSQLCVKFKSGAVQVIATEP